MKFIPFLIVVGFIWGTAGHAEPESSPRRRPLSTPRVYDQAPTVLPVDSLFHAAPARGREENLMDTVRESVPRNRALDITVQPIAPLVPVQADSGSDRDRERDEERNRSWLRPVDFLGEEDLPRVDTEDQERDRAGEETLDWSSLRESMAARELESEDFRDRNTRDSEENGREGEDAVFSIRDRTAEGLSMAPVQGGRERQLDAVGAAAASGPGAPNRPQSPTVLPPAMRMAPVMRGAAAPSDFEVDRPLERSRNGGLEGARSRFADPVASRENRWAPREPSRVERPLSPPPSPVLTGSSAPSIRNEPMRPPQPAVATPLGGPARRAPSTPEIDVRRFRPEEFSIRSSDSWSRP